MSVSLGDQTRARRWPSAATLAVTMRLPASGTGAFHANAPKRVRKAPALTANGPRVVTF